MPCDSGGPCECACVFSFIAREAAGASSIRHSLRPLLPEAREFLGKTRTRGVARSRRRVCFSSPSLRERSEWRGGVGGGGCLRVLSSIEFAEAPPPPTPSHNAQEHVGGGEQTAR